MGLNIVWILLKNLFDVRIFHTFFQHDFRLEQVPSHGHIPVQNGFEEADRRAEGYRAVFRAANVWNKNISRVFSSSVSQAVSRRKNVLRGLLALISRAYQSRQGSKVP